MMGQSMGRMRNIARLRNVVLQEDKKFSTHMDQSEPLSFGFFPSKCLQEYFEITSELASLDLARAGSTGHILHPHDTYFKMVQQDVIACHLADGSAASLFLVNCTLHNSSGKLTSAEVDLGD